MEKLQFVGHIQYASIYYDQEENIFRCEPDSSEGFYFDEQDLGAFPSSTQGHIAKLIEMWQQQI